MTVNGNGTLWKVGGIALVSVVALGGLGKLAGLELPLGGEPAEGIAGAQVKRGPLRISVVERANLKAKSSVELKSELERSTTILSLIPEGTWVEPGDVVCELDTAELVERRLSQDISVQNSEAAWVKAVQNLEIQRSQNASDIAKAEQLLLFAEQDLMKYLEGDWPQQRKEAEEAILLAEEDLSRKENDLEWSQKLHDQGFYTASELEADRIAANSARILLDQRERALRLLDEYDNPRQVLEFESAIEECERELERVKLQAKARIVDFEADERTSAARLELERDELAKLDDQIAKAIMVAPVAGQVVYATDEGRRWSGGEPIQEGTEVRERQKIITIPSSEGMIAELSLHESVLEKVEEGMPCLIRVDALQDRTFSGRVRFKSTLPDQNSWWANPDLRVYRSEVELTEVDERLKSGMSCSVEVVVDDIEDALHVPVQSIFLDAGRTVCFVDDGGVSMREVEVGQDNGKWVHVLAGLEEGETVLLSQPAGFTLEPAPQGGSELPELEGSPGPGGGASAGGQGKGDRGGKRGSSSGRGGGAPAGSR